MNTHLTLANLVVFSFGAGTSFVIALHRNWKVDWLFFAMFCLGAAGYIIILGEKLK